MDVEIYSEAVINRFLKKNLFFNDLILKKHYDNNNLSAFRKRVSRMHKGQTFEKIVYALVTDQIRDIVMKIVGELSSKLKPYGDLVISGGEAFNKYIDRENRIITSDIDTKFIPRIKYDTKYFGKLQMLKLLTWDKLGQISQNYNTKIKDRVAKCNSKIAKFIGLGFAETGPYVTRRYILIKKKKGSENNSIGKKDVFIDVELFALDLNVRYFSIEKGKIEPFTLGGILDIHYMRPKEFGYEIVKTQRRGVTYKNKDTGRMIHDKRISIASKQFLIEDVYLMQKLGLRPEKKEKDRQRMVKLSKMIDKNIKINNDDSVEKIFGKIRSKINTPVIKSKEYSNVPVSVVKNINPNKYTKYTTKPVRERLSKQIVYGVKASVPNMNIKGYNKTHGKQKLSLHDQKWKKTRSKAYIGNEFTHRPTNAKEFNKNLDTSKLLYGYRKNRDGWIPKYIVRNSSKIPFVGLKN